MSTLNGATSSVTSAVGDFGGGTIGKGRNMMDGPRGLMPGEMDELVELVEGVFRPRMRQQFPTMYCEENVDHMRIIKVDGKIVCHVGVVVRDMILNGCRISVGSVGSVCTHEDYRKRGYAWLALEDTMDTCRTEGVDVLLVSGFRSLYRLHGCTHVGKVARYHVTRDMELPETEARPFRLDDLRAWSTLYRSEPVRFHRPHDDFRKLVAMQVPESRRRPLYSIWEGNRIVAYAVVEMNRSASVPGESLWLCEYAGSRRALLGAMRTWCEELHVQGVEVPVPAHDLELVGMLDSIGAGARYDSTGGTIAVIRYPALCRKLMPMFEECVGRRTAGRLNFQERDGGYVISLDSDEVVFDDVHDVARLIFGNPAGHDERTEITAQGALRDVLEIIFPVPRPEYGLNYI